MKYDYNFYHQHLRRIKREEEIRISELKKIIAVIKSRLDYQHTIDMYAKPANVGEATFWNRGFYAACESLITMLEACILDYEGKL